MIQAQTIFIDDQPFHVLTAGKSERPALLFLHGFPEYSGAWSELMERLSDQFFCIAPDQRGYGQSCKPTAIGDYATGKLAGDAAAILLAFAPSAHAVIGHDWGASVAYALAFARPDLVERLIIMNGVHPVPFMRALTAGGAQSTASTYIDELRDPGAEARLRADNFARLSGLFAKGMDMGWLAGERLEAYRAAWAEHGALTGMLNWYRATPLVVARPGEPLAMPVEFDPARLRVRMPHLLIWGTGDTVLLPEATVGLEGFCDELERVELDGVDHWLHHQKPDAVAALIAGFRR